MGNICAIEDEAFALKEFLKYHVSGSKLVMHGKLTWINASRFGSWLIPPFLKHNESTKNSKLSLCSYFSMVILQGEQLTQDWE